MDWSRINIFDSSRVIRESSRFPFAFGTADCRFFLHSARNDRLQRDRDILKEHMIQWTSFKRLGPPVSRHLTRPWILLTSDLWLTFPSSCVESKAHFSASGFVLNWDLHSHWNSHCMILYDMTLTLTLIIDNWSWPMDSNFHFKF